MLPFRAMGIVLLRSVLLLYMKILNDEWTCVISDLNLGADHKFLDGSVAMSSDGRLIVIGIESESFGSSLTRFLT